MQLRLAALFHDVKFFAKSKCFRYFTPTQITDRNKNVVVITVQVNTQTIQVLWVEHTPLFKT